jgi:hypothetical protein
MIELRWTADKSWLQNLLDAVLDVVLDNDNAAKKIEYATAIATN